MSVRRLQPDELPALESLARSWQVAEGAGEVVFVASGPAGGTEGFVRGWLAADIAEITSIAVAPSARRRGLGRLLLDAWAEHARGEAAEQLWLEVAAGNSAAIALYRACGYSEVGRRPRYYRDGDDAVLMGRAP